MKSKLLTVVVFFYRVISLFIKPVPNLFAVLREMRITRLRLILLLCAHLQHTKLAPFQPLTAYFKAKTVGSRSRDRNLMFYEGVRFIVFVVAVQRDRIHKSAWKEKIQNYAPFEFNKRCNFDKKQLNWTLIYRNKLIQKK